MYRKVETAIWADERFRELSDPQPCGKYLWFVLMTGKHTCQIPGVILAGPDEVAAFLRWDQTAFGKAFAEVAAKGMAKTNGFDLIWLPQAPKHNKPESPNVVRSWRKTWPLVPECSLKGVIWQELRVFVEGLGTPFEKAFHEACGKPCPNQEQEQEQEQKKDLVPHSSETPSPSKAKREQPEEAYRLADLLRDHIRRRLPDNREVSEKRWPKTRESWANYIRLMHEVDARDWDRIENAITWSQSDSFWQSNVISGKGLRTAYDRMSAQRRSRPQTSDEKYAAAKARATKL